MSTRRANVAFACVFFLLGNGSELQASPKLPRTSDFTVSQKRNAAVYVTKSLSQSPTAALAKILFSFAPVAVFSPGFCGNSAQSSHGTRRCQNSQSLKMLTVMPALTSSEDAGGALTAAIAPLLLAPVVAILAVTLSRSGALSLSQDPAEWEETFWRWDRESADEKILFQNGSLSVRERDEGRCRVMKFKDSFGSVAMWKEGKLQEQAVAFEYLKVMLSAAVATSPWMSHWGQDDLPSESLNVLHLGLGGGTIPSFLSSLQSSLTDHIGRNTAVELDESVVTAARAHMGLSPSVNVVIGDASDFDSWHDGQRYDIVFVDLFDDEGQVPLVFQSAKFVADLQSKILERDGVVVANFQNNNAADQAALKAGSKAYKSGFADGAVLHVRSRYQGHTILVACNEKLRPDAVSVASTVAQKAQWTFDPVERLQGRMEEI